MFLIMNEACLKCQKMPKGLKNVHSKLLDTLVQNFKEKFTPLTFILLLFKILNIVIFY